MTGKPKRKGGEPIWGEEGETQRGARGREGRGREGCGASKPGSGYRLIRLAFPLVFNWLCFAVAVVVTVLNLRGGEGVALGWAGGQNARWVHTDRICSK